MTDSASLNKESIDKIGSKKLIYYTVYGETYVKLLEKSLESLYETSINDFDVLIIADLETINQIEKLDIVNENRLEFYYHVVSKPIDGIEASMNKTKIYDFEFIDNYSHILFLDCDIISIKDVNLLFQNITDSSKFYCICNPSVNSGGYLGIYHGLNYNKDEVFELAIKGNYRPFNAGQFAFINSKRMRKHFSNINSFIENWDGEYFFEQVFMNIYFLYCDCLNDSLSNMVCLANATVENLDKRHSENDVLIHFIAPALLGDVKIKYLERYLYAHKS